MRGLAARRGAKGRGASLVVALLGLVVLAGLAFLLGALAGLVWKEPDLVLAYVRGETTEIAWTTSADASLPGPAGAPSAEGPEASSGTEPPAPEAAPPAASAPERPATAAPRAKPAAEPSPPAVAAAPPVLPGPARIAVQVGAFGERAAAERLRADLQQDGFPAYVATAAREGAPRWRVRVGPYPSRDEAEGVAARLKRAHRLPTWVLDEDAE